MKKLLYLITIILLLCSSCRTKQTLQEYSVQTDSTRTENSTKKEVTRVERSASSLISACDTMSSSMIMEEFTIKFDSTGKPTEFHGTKKKWMQQTKSEKNTSQEQQMAADKLSCDSNYIFADIKQNQYKKIVKPEKKSSKNVLFAVMLSLLTLIICHCVLKQKIKQKKLGA
uniref:hypothetical protein n=1 Tax=Prevotella sp. TaxID=59823 RepID=UPI004029B8C4